MVTYETQPTAIQRECQFIFRMVMPFKRYFRNLAMKNADRTAFWYGDVFELRLHFLTLANCRTRFDVELSE
jgi:hypothetical protein